MPAPTNKPKSKSKLKPGSKGSRGATPNPKAFGAKHAKPKAKVADKSKPHKPQPGKPSVRATAPGSAGTESPGADGNRVARASAAGSYVVGPSPWLIMLAELPKVVKMALDQGKTPIVLDNTATEAALTYFHYQSFVPVDAKALIVRKALQGLAAEELRVELRDKLLMSWGKGYPLLISLQNSAPDFAGLLCGPGTFPAEVLETRKIEMFDGKTKKLVATQAANTRDGRAALGPDAAQSAEIARSEIAGRLSGCHTVLTSTFDPDDAAEFLEPMLPIPIAAFQFICVKDEA